MLRVVRNVIPNLDRFLMLTIETGFHKCRTKYDKCVFCHYKHGRSYRKHFRQNISIIWYELQHFFPFLKSWLVGYFLKRILLASKFDRTRIQEKLNLWNETLEWLIFLDVWLSLRSVKMFKEIIKIYLTRKKYSKNRQRHWHLVMWYR